MCASKVSRRQMPSAKQDEILQVKCLINDEGHVWIHCYDALPATVRQRLRNSPFNLCAACLEMVVVPKVKRKYPSLSREQQLLIAIKVMEAEVRKGA
jgi:hypothetical protein